MNVESGNEIQSIADNVHRQNGINDGILQGLRLIGEQSKNLFEEILMELIINLILKRVTFSDHLLVYVWNIAKNRHDNVLDSDLWKAISNSCSQIVTNGNFKDWMWLKLCLLPSMIWYKDLSKESAAKPHYLYYELLKLVDVGAMNHLNNLKENLMKMADKQKDEWLALTTWDIPDQYELARQDVIFNGIVSRYTFNQLSASSGTTFNSPQFYDYNQYLSQLVLLAQIGTILYFPLLYVCVSGPQ